MNLGDFGTFLRKLRKGKGLTVRGLSELSGISPSYITNLENGKRGIPSPEVLKNFAPPLGVTHQEMMVRAGHITYEDWFKGDAGAQDQVYADMFLPDMLGPSQSQDLKIALEDYGFSFYNGHRLTEDDRKRILIMLEQLFPQYISDKNKSL